MRKNTDTRYLLIPVGVVRSSLKSLEECPRQGPEGGAEAWLEIDPAFTRALDGTPIMDIKSVLAGENDWHKSVVGE